jgi:hypothetical protein
MVFVQVYLTLKFVDEHLQKMAPTEPAVQLHNVHD